MVRVADMCAECSSGTNKVIICISENNVNNRKVRKKKRKKMKRKYT